MDLIGNDINYAVSCQVYEALGKPERLQPSPLQKKSRCRGTWPENRKWLLRLSCKAMKKVVYTLELRLSCGSATNHKTHFLLN